LEVFFEDSRLGQAFESDRELQRRFGTERAKKLRTRRSALRAAETLEDLRHAPGRCHELAGNYAGLLSLDLDGPYRLFFRPAEEADPKPGGGLEGGTVMGARGDNLYQLRETDYATSPGETLQDLMEEQGLTQRDLARRADLSPKHVNQLLHGLVSLSPAVAQRLELVTGMPARMWNQLEALYQSDLQRIQARRNLAEYSAWLDAMPVKALLRRGILPEIPTDRASRVQQMLSFFGVASVSAWDGVYASLECAFRQSAALEIKPGAVAAWLRLGEIAAREVKCAPFDAKGLRSALPELRELTSEPSVVFAPRMQAICAAYGVAVVFVEEVEGARASGVMRWLTPDKALIQLSFRYRTDDHLWFTFFHEIGHVLLHGKSELWIEDSGPPGSDPKEVEADRFSRDLLIRPAVAADLRNLKSKSAVIDFARRTGIAPGIVVGRLQHDSIWPPANGNGLKRKLDLSHSEIGLA
jgi:HTH-type transcriptional regulator / antitoxin HigA